MIYSHHNYYLTHNTSARPWALLVNNDFTGLGASAGLPSMEQIDAAFAEGGAARTKVLAAASSNLALLVDVEGPLHHAWSIDNKQIKAFAEALRAIFRHIRAISFGIPVALYGLPLADNRGRTGQALASGDHDSHPNANWWKVDPSATVEISGKKKRRKQVLTRLSRSRGADGRFHATGLIDDTDILAVPLYADRTVIDFKDDIDHRSILKGKYWAPIQLQEAMSYNKRVMPLISPLAWVDGGRYALPEQELRDICQSCIDAGITDAYVWLDWDLKTPALLAPFISNLAIIVEYFGSTN